jgi:hypothetical protein
MGSQRHTTPVGLGVPAAASFLDLQDEETTTYDARRTPAVSLHALLLEAERGLEPPVPEPPPAEPPAPKAAVPPPRLPPPAPPPVPSPRPREPSTVSISLEDSDVELIPPEKVRVEKMQVFDSPAASVNPAPLSRRPPSFARWLVARLLFVLILAFVGLLGAAELSIALHEPQLDPRPHLTRYVKLVGERLRALGH